MHDSVTYSLDVIQRLEDSMFTISKSLENKLHSDLVVRNRQILYYFILTDNGMLKTPSLQTDFLYNTFGEEIVDFIALHVKQLILDG